MKNYNSLGAAIATAVALFSASCTQIPQRIEGAAEGSGGPRSAVDA